MKQQALKKQIAIHKYLYLLLLPAMIYFVLFKYVPIYGIILAFKEFSFAKGIWGSAWVGLRNFQEIFILDDFRRSVSNTLIIASYRLVFEFPLPILLALMINEIGGKKFKRSIQTVLTFPHFLSWIIISGMLTNLLGDSGSINRILLTLGLEKSDILTDPSTFRPFLVMTNNWKEAGWGTIIYLAALSGVDPSLYEAAEIDGASRLHKMRYINWPCILPTVSIMLILFLGGVMSSGGGGFDQIFNLYNPAVYHTGDIIDTYIYRRTFILGDTFESSTAIGLFKSIINMILLFTANRVVNKMSDGSGGLF